MISLPQHSSVLIIGAGPSGLMMAAQLLRYGILPVIIDSKQGPTNQSKALAVQARSMEIYRQMGIVDQVMKGGKPAAGVQINQEGATVATLALHEAGLGQTLFPYVFMFPQSKNERVLLDYLTVNCCPVYWNTSLQTIQHIAGGVEANLHTEGATHILRCDYIIGADGAHSVLRKQLGIPFNGDTYQHKFFLADVKINNSFGDDLVHLFMIGKGFAGFFLLPEEGAYRIVGNLPPELTMEPERLTFNDILPHLESVVSRKLDIEQINWFTLYKLHHRMADRFSNGRCFLIGDAAHIHSPVGGQGMNTGLQDAYNLAWKLAGVIKGTLAGSILDTYAAERMPVARQLLNTTDKVFHIVTSQRLFSRLLKRFVMPPVLRFLGNMDEFRSKLFNAVSQTSLNYRDSKLNLHLSHHTTIKAGDRLPFLEIFDEKKQAKTDLHAWCAKPGFTLITIGDIKESYLFTLAKWLTQQYAGTINFFHLPPSEKNQHVFDVFKIPAGHRKALIIRPDMYIAYMNDTVDLALMDNYLRDVAGFLA